jgi:hypothetical protein
MSKREKRLQRIRNSPQKVLYDDLVLLLMDYGFVERNPKNSGSHRVFTCGQHTLTVPRHRPYVGQFYVSQALLLIDGLEEEQTP